MSLNKLKWVIGSMIVFLIIISTNLIDRNYFKELKSSIRSIYEDRLVVKDYILDLSLLLEEKTIAYLTEDAAYNQTHNQKVNKEIAHLVDRFYETKLVPGEKVTLDAFVERMEKFKELEQSYFDRDTDMDRKEYIGLISKELTELKEDLSTLSEIQLEEGKRELMVARKAMDSIELMTKMEIIFLIAMIVLVPIILLYKPKRKLNQANQ